MKRVLVFLVAVVGAAAALVVLRPADSSAPIGWRLPRTPYGTPDLQGVWGNNTETPAPRRWIDAVGDFLAAPSSPESFIIDPPDGRFPAITPEARARAASAAARRPSGGPEDRTLAERCITFGAPNTLANHNSYTQIVQSPDTVVLLQEVIHDARVVTMTGRPHLPKQVRQLHGDPRGRWDGDTLVVETTNYVNGFQGSTPDVTITERYTRLGPGVINWQITVNDPATWTRPFTVQIRLRKADTPIYEYACHEGNYPTLEGLLTIGK